jgi:predicted RNase H-like nuclease (RuvC/YqgF family)
MDESFDVLEEKVRKAAELVKRLRKENRALDEDLGKARARLEAAEKRLAALEKDAGASHDHGQKLDALGQQLKALQLERGEVRSRIAKLVEVLDSLD